jgi:hypothetical protein
MNLLYYLYSQMLAIPLRKERDLVQHGAITQFGGRGHRKAIYCLLRRRLICFWLCKQTFVSSYKVLWVQTQEAPKAKLRKPRNRWRSLEQTRQQTLKH